MWRTALESFVKRLRSRSVLAPLLCEQPRLHEDVDTRPLIELVGGYGGKALLHHQLRLPDQEPLSQAERQVQLGLGHHVDELGRQVRLQRVEQEGVHELQVLDRAHALHVHQSRWAELLEVFEQKCHCKDERGQRALVARLHHVPLQRRDVLAPELRKRTRLPAHIPPVPAQIGVECEGRQLPQNVSLQQKFGQLFQILASSLLPRLQPVFPPLQQRSHTLHHIVYKPSLGANVSAICPHFRRRTAVLLCARLCGLKGGQRCGRGGLPFRRQQQRRERCVRVNASAYLPRKLLDFAQCHVRHLCGKVPADLSVRRKASRCPYITQPWQRSVYNLASRAAIRG